MRRRLPRYGLFSKKASSESEPPSPPLAGSNSARWTVDKDVVDEGISQRSGTSIASTA
jgi:hypothetical protein